MILALVCSAATLLFYGITDSERKSWLSRIITVNLMTIAAIFGFLVVFEVEGERLEIAASLVSELPFGLVVACLCVAQAGYLPQKIGGPPLAVVAGRPKLRLLLVSAAFTLPAVWLAAAIFGFLRPSPAVQALAPAPPEFVVFKLMLMVPAAFYATLAATLFLYAAGAASVAMSLRLKNAAFAIAASCLAMVAIGSSLFAGARAWLPDEERMAALRTLNAVEMGLAISCVSAFILGVALRYTPAMKAHLVRQAATRWLPEQDRFDAHRWRVVVGGVTRGVVRATRRIDAAAERLGLSQEQTEHAVRTLQHIATMRAIDPDREVVSPEAARILHDLQAEVVGEEGLALKIRKLESEGLAPGSVSESAASLHAELEAALDLMEQTNRERSNGIERPLWFYLAAVGASDVNLIDASRVNAFLGDRTGYGAAREAYAEAVAAAKDGLGSR